MSDLLKATSPVTRRVRAFFAPVDRVAGVPAVFDPATVASFNVDAPPAPWLDLGWCTGFARHSGTGVEALVAGAPGVVVGQVRTAVEASVQVAFASWGKLQMALTCGAQQRNVLSGAAVEIGAGSTASTLAVAGLDVGDVVAVDLDYAGAKGFVGSGASGGYVKDATAIGSDIDYVRRVTWNVARVVDVADGVATLGTPLLAGAPVAGMQASKVVGFCDREGGSFFAEWSALFVLEGVEGDRVAFHYPRLQSATGAVETHDVLLGSLDRMRLQGSFRALPVRDVHDGEMTVCYRSYLPAAMRNV